MSDSNRDSMPSASGSKVPFGLKNGRMVSVGQVASGLACGCVCPACGGRLQARKRRISRQSKRNYTDHFAHDPKASNATHCAQAFETSVHRMAKQILMQASRINLPGLKLKVSRQDMHGISHTMSHEVMTKGYRDLGAVRAEVAYPDMRPDLEATIDGHTVLIEIAVTHFADREKINRFRELGLNALEIDLSKVNLAITEEELTALLVDSVKKKRWLSLAHVPKMKAKLERRLKARIRAINERGYRLRAARRSQQSFAKAQGNADPRGLSGSMFRDPGEEFHQREGRYPTIAECRKLWPVNKRG